MKQVYIGFGSNVGDSVAHFQNTQTLLLTFIAMTSFQVSPAYWSEPLRKNGATSLGDEQPYLNAVFEFQTELDLITLFHNLEALEKKLGRTSGKREWKPRTVDLDILFYGDVIFHDQTLHVPHRQMTERRFVLQPLADIAPNWVHPEFGLTVKKLLDLCDDSLKVWPCSP